MEKEMEQRLIKNENNSIVYTDEENDIKVEAILQNGDVWLNMEALAKLFQIDRTGITKHIQHIYQKKELEKNSTCAFFAQVQNEGTRSITRNIVYYNLDMVIAIGFRVHSKSAFKFRIWANQVMKEYMVKGLSKRLPIWTRCWYYIKNKIKTWLKQ